MEEVAQDMETRISCAMRARIREFKDQEDSLTLERVRRSLEKDMGLKKFTLDAHKRFIKQCLHECLCDDENVSTYMGKNSEQVVHSVETEGDKSEKIPSEDIIKKAIKKRASYFRDNSETITLSGARRLLEEDLKLEKNALDAHKSFISKQLDEVLQSPEVVESITGYKKKGPKKASDSKVRGGSSKRFRKVSGGHGNSDSSDVSSSGEEGIEEQRVKEKTQAVKKVAARNNEGQKKRKDVSSSCEEGIEEQRIKQKTQAVKKVAARNNEGQKKRKRSTEERKPSRKEKNKRVKLAVKKGSNTDGGGHSSEDGKSKSSAEEPVKKKRETSTQVYGKRVEQLKSIIKACRMSIPPSVYKRAKQAPENKRDAHLIKELEEILGKGGLSSNPSEKEIKEVKKQRERAKLGIDVSNIVSSSRRRSTSNFIIPPPQPRLAVEKNNGGGAGDDDEEDTDDEESESEGTSEEIKDVKKQKKRAKLSIDMSNIVSSSRRRSTSNLIIPPPKPRLAVEKNGGVGGGGGGDDDDKEDTNDEESESEGVCEGITLHAGDSSTSAQGSNTRKKIEFNQVGQLVGENAVSFSTFIGRLTRAHCPIRYADWRSVPASDKDNLWSMIRDTYEIDEKYKEKVLQKVNKSLRNWKWELRRHYDKFDQDAERKRNCPKGVKQEEWEVFIDVESSEQSISRRENGKASRKEMKHPHTTGRRGAARTAEKMLMENPNAIITRTDLYVATHTRSDGSYPTPELSITMERIKSIIASDPASTQRDLDHDPVAQVCGRDSRGLVRGMGEGISKTTIMASTPYMEEARTERNAHVFLESKMETTMVEMIKRLDEEKALRMTMEQQLADIRQQIAFQGQQVHCSPDTTASQAYPQSGDASSLREDSAPTPRTIQICRLLSGRLMRDNIGI